MPHIKDIWLHANKVIRSARQIINDNLRPLNLSSAEGNILIHLLTQGQDLGQDQLVEQLDVSKPAVSRALDALERKGYVTRHTSPGDRRARRVKLTNKAKRIGPAIEQAYNQVYQQALRGISAEELETFISLFSHMSKNFD